MVGPQEGATNKDMNFAPLFESHRALYPEVTPVGRVYIITAFEHFNSQCISRHRRQCQKLSVHENLNQADVQRMMGGLVRLHGGSSAP